MRHLSLQGRWAAWQRQRAPACWHRMAWHWQRKRPAAAAGAASRARAAAALRRWRPPWRGRPPGWPRARCTAPVWHAPLQQHATTITSGPTASVHAIDDGHQKRYSSICGRRWERSHCVSLECLWQTHQISAVAATGLGNLSMIKN